LNFIPKYKYSFLLLQAHEQTAPIIFFHQMLMFSLQKRIIVNLKEKIKTLNFNPQPPVKPNFNRPAQFQIIAFYFLTQKVKAHTS
jgi:hypothetical protein